MPRKILLIRHRQAAEKTARALERVGANSVIFPLSQTKFINNDMPEGNFDAVIFTSPLAPKMLCNHIWDKSSKNTISDLPVYCVGDYTARCAKEAGFSHIAEIAKDAVCLALKLEQAGDVKNIIYPCGKNRSFDFTAHLKKSGIASTNWEIYSNELLAPDDASFISALKATNTLLLFSKRTSEHLFKVIEATNDKSVSPCDLSRHEIIAISENVAACVPRKLLANTYIAEDKNENSMIECLGNI